MNDNDHIGDGHIADAVGSVAEGGVSPQASVPSPASDELLDLRPQVSNDVSYISCDKLDDDYTFLIRARSELDEVAGLATELARTGQLFPIDVRVSSEGRYQVVCGFRRVAALRVLQREGVLARVHKNMEPKAAMLMALTAAIHMEPVPQAQLAVVQREAEAKSLLTPAARDLLARAFGGAPELGPEQVETEVDADDLAIDVAVRLNQCNQDLSMLADYFGELQEGRRTDLLQQLRYFADLSSYLENRQ